MQNQSKVSLILVSLLGLFLELAFIRWLPDNVFSLAYFSNIVLISSFLGLGLGFILASKKQDFFKYFPIVLLGIVVLFILFRQILVIIPVSENEMVWSSYYPHNWISIPKIQVGIIATLVCVFIFNSLPFILIGQKMALLMKKFQSLTAYGLDIFGALLGIIVFGIFSFIGGALSSPPAWFFCAGIISLWLLKENKKYFIIGAASVLAIVAIMYNFSKDEIWSPYYSIRIEKAEVDDSIMLFVNNFFFQKAVNFDSDIEAREKYKLPYVLKKPQKVLILGAGTGNDVAIAGMQDVPEIDAVELDPTIVDIGRKMHPTHPYQNPNVNIFIDDARSFLKKSDKRYDMIVLGTLDSHALLSARSTVRLDNFVYTQEALQEIKGHLNDRGIVVLMFSTPEQWLGDKIIKGVQTVFYSPEPIVYKLSPYLFNLMIIAGPGIPDMIKNYPLQTAQFQQISENSFDVRNVATDNWPYLYLREHAVSGYYLGAIGILLAASFLGVFLLFSGRRKSLMSWDSLNFFCLGAAFLLLETKSITTLSLLFGSTWLVNTFVFGGILTMVLLANIVVSRIAIRRIGTVYILLGLSLVLNYLLPASVFLGADFWTRSIMSALVIAFPIFFASIIFSFHFRSVTDISTLYGLNLVGAVFGGFFEYGSMITGLNFLYVIAGVIYLLSYISFKKTRNSQTV